MASHMTPDAQAVSIRAYEQAIRLGHRYLGGEHFLLVLSAVGVSAPVLRAAIRNRYRRAG